MTTREWREVTKAEPCPACGKPDWCAWSDEGYLKCERSRTPPPGMVAVSEKDGGGVFAWSNQNGHPPPKKKAPVARTREGGGKNDAQVYATGAEALRAINRIMGRKAAKWWSYCNAADQPVGLVARFETESGKTYRPIARTSAGWVVGAMPTPRPLYALPDLLKTKPGERVYVCEGEKTTDAARSLGLTATTSAGGCKAAKQTDWSPLAGRDVVVLPDNDEPGIGYAADVTRLATAAGAKSVRVVRLGERYQDLPVGGDLADLAERASGDAEALAALAREVEAMADNTEPEKPKALVIDGSPVVVRLADVQPEPVAWLWPGRVALGKLTLLVGDPGLGKSFLTLDVAARVSRGTAWPDGGENVEPGGVVLLSAEDAIADTIRPRLDAAGADVARIVAVEAIRSVGDNGRESARAFDLSRDLPALEAAIESVESCRLVVIDPVTAYLGGVDSHKNAEIRGLLAPLGEMAERHRVAVIAVTHLNKSGGGPAIYRAMGSLAFAAAARAAWAVSKDKDDQHRRLLLPIKNNIAPDTGGLAYRIEPLGVDGCPVLAWEPEPVTVSADDALAGDRDEGGGHTERDEAAEWLANLLADGPKLAKDVLTEAREAGFSKRTIDRAKPLAGVRTRKEAFGGGWVWELSAPSEERQPTGEGCHTPHVGNLRRNSGEITEKRPKVATSEGLATLGASSGNLGVATNDDNWGEL